MLRLYERRASPRSRDLALCDRDLGYPGWLFFHINAIDRARPPNRAGKLRSAHALITCLCFDTKWRSYWQLLSTKPQRRRREEKGKEKQFRWDSEMAENLITCLQSFKSKMEYENVDFDGDRPAQYSWLRQEMSKLYEVENTSLFGPVYVTQKQPVTARGVTGDLARLPWPKNSHVNTVWKSSRLGGLGGLGGLARVPGLASPI